MKAPNALALLEFPVVEKATDFIAGADSEYETTDYLQDSFQPVRPWAKPFADRPTPDDWPVDD